jgi:streptogramin lyase
MVAVVPAADAAELERFPLPPAMTWASSPVLGPDGALWFEVTQGVGRLDPDGRARLFRGPQVSGLTPGPEGALWGAVFLPDGVYDDGFARVDMDGRITFIRAQGARGIMWVVAGPAGDLWAAEDLVDNSAIVRMTTTGDVTSRTRIPADIVADSGEAAADGALWFLYDGGLGRLSVDGRLTLTSIEGVDDSEVIAVSPDGAVWISLDGREVILRVGPDGSRRRVPVGVAPIDIVAGPDGRMWFSFYASSGSGVGRLDLDGSRLQLWRDPFRATESGDLGFDAAGNVWMAAPRELQRLVLAAAPVAPAPLAAAFKRRGRFRDAHTLRSGPDGAMWLTTSTGVLRIDGAGVQRHYNDGAAAKAYDVLPERDGSAWIAYNGPGIAKLAPDGTIRRHTRGFRRTAKVRALAAGRGKDVWFIDKTDNTVGRWRPGGPVRRIVNGLGPRRDLLTLALGSDGRMWVTDQAGAILAISSSGRIRRYTRGLGRRPEPTAITAGPDGNMWFTMFSRRRIGRITPSGRVRLWRSQESPAAITQGPDGALWFTTAGSELYDTVSGVGRIDIRGRVREYHVRPTLTTGFNAIAPGPDGTISFLVDRGPTAVARIDPRRLLELGTDTSGIARAVG